ncbi:hypothetical protein NM208_g12259 [Fusarium decemcellulare]|uniref:Uncharacterized protein n=1 Tax=Fusarium decemcellulare TaxID=57161 RepID=A0ACC1RPB0_9HYPO|nr:hypothetical protein NM208_g12259 [Fusarium decemcellulare]
MLLYLALFIITCIMAHILPHSVIQRLRNLSFPIEDPSGDDHSNDASASNKNPNLTPIDVIVTRVMLTKGKKLPPGIVDVIFDFAEYWAHSSNEFDYLAEHQDPLRVHGSSHSENKFLLRSFPVGLTGIQGKKDLAEVLAYDTNEAKPQPLGKEHEPSYFAKLADYPTPKLLHPVRKVVFSMRSKDQGFGGDDPENRHTFRGSWTWFEAGLEKFDADQVCDASCTYDVRFKSPSSKASPLPVCGLRPLYPSIVPDEENEEEDRSKYTHLNEESESKEKGQFKYTHPLSHQDKWVIKCNKTAHREWQDHVVTWSYLDNIDPESADAQRLEDEEGRGKGTGDGWFVRDLKLGDVITVWAKARFPAWVNHIEKVKVDVYWATPFPPLLRTMSTLKGHNIPLNLPEGLSQDQLTSFKPFNNWIDTLTNSLRLQSDESHPFHADPYALRSVTIQAFDRFGPSRLGFVKLTATVSNGAGEKLPAAALLRGPSVAMLVMLIPDDVPPESDERYVVLTVQPRVPAGSLGFVELPAGMVDDAGSFKGAAAQEIKEELGVTIHEDELTSLSELAAPTQDSNEGLPSAMFPSAGGCDEHITIFSHEKRIPRDQLKEWSGRLTGLRTHGEKITLKVVPMKDAWREGARDAKCLAALALWQGLRQERKL